MALLKFLALFSLLTYVHSLAKDGMSDFQVGVLGENDKFLTNDHNEYVFNPEQILIYSKIGLGLPNRVITFVTADEAGGNSDARARISDGGPGYDFVEVEIIPGPSQSYHYVITVYGRDLETPEVDTSEKKVSKSFFYK